MSRWGRRRCDPNHRHPSHRHPSRRNLSHCSLRRQSVRHRCEDFKRRARFLRDRRCLRCRLIPWPLTRLPPTRCRRVRLGSRLGRHPVRRFLGHPLSPARRLTSRHRSSRRGSSQLSPSQLSPSQLSPSQLSPSRPSSSQPLTSRRDSLRSTRHPPSSRRRPPVLLGPPGNQRLAGARRRALAVSSDLRSG